MIVPPIGSEVTYVDQTGAHEHVLGFVSSVSATFRLSGILCSILLLPPFSTEKGLYPILWSTKGQKNIPLAPLHPIPPSSQSRPFSLGSSGHSIVCYSSSCQLSRVHPHSSSLPKRARAPFQSRLPSFPPSLLSKTLPAQSETFPVPPIRPLRPPPGVCTRAAAGENSQPPPVHVEPFSSCSPGPARPSTTRAHAPPRPTSNPFPTVQPSIHRPTSRQRSEHPHPIGKTIALPLRPPSSGIFACFVEF